MATERGERLLSIMKAPRRQGQSAQEARWRADRAIRNLEYQLSMKSPPTHLVLLPVESEQGMTTMETAIVDHMIELLGVNLRQRAYVVRLHLNGHADETPTYVILRSELEMMLGAK
jgi:hypothetical protein